ncbi:MAG: hypothetical protein JWR46_840, partial [Mycobacterium sp.]|nr:hypothetical protein [Mycobacterium sp.]
MPRTEGCDQSEVIRLEGWRVGGLGEGVVVFEVFVVSDGLASAGAELAVAP